MQKKVVVDNAVAKKADKATTLDGYGIVDGATADNLKKVSDQVTNLAKTKQDVLTFDSTPTENSTNPVTSDGVYKAVAKAVVLNADGHFVFPDGSELWVES